MSADPVKGKTVRWTYADGPLTGKTFEHHFTNDGTVSWNEPGGGKPSADSSAKYEFARINDDVYVFSYLAGSGYTLTTVIDERTGKIVSVASNEKHHTIQAGELSDAKVHPA